MYPQKISAAAKNIMILKYLLNRKSFKKVIIAITWWDEFTEDGSIPADPDLWLQKNSPALYNFIKHYCNDFKIIGISAQGCNYENNNFNKDEVTRKTTEGKRAFVEIDNQIEYDLSLPLYMLITK